MAARRPCADPRRSAREARATASAPGRAAPQAARRGCGRSGRDVPAASEQPAAVFGPQGIAAHSFPSAARCAARALRREQVIALERASQAARLNAHDGIEQRIELSFAPNTLIAIAAWLSAGTAPGEPLVDDIAQEIPRARARVEVLAGEQAREMLAHARFEGGAAWPAVGMQGVMLLRSCIVSHRARSRQRPARCR